MYFLVGLFHLCLFIQGLCDSVEKCGQEKLGEGGKAEEGWGNKGMELSSKKEKWM